MKTPEELAERVTRHPEDGSWCMNPEEAFLAGYAAAQPKWISVKERLPEFDKDGYTEDVLLRRYDEAIYLSWFKKQNGLVTGGNFYGLDQITHWMPLPEPPKENE